MNANWDLAQQLIEAGADVNQWDIYGEAPLFTAVGLRNRIDGGRASIDPLNKTNGLTIVSTLLERGANPNMQLFFKPANVRGTTNTRGATPLIRAANNGDLEVVKLLLEHGADATLYMADRQTPIHAVLAGRAPEPQALELIRVLHKAGADVNVIALVNHEEESRGGTALHYAVRKRYKEVIKLLASVWHRPERHGSGRPHGAGLHAVPRLHAVHGAADSTLQGGGGAAARAGRDRS